MQSKHAVYLGKENNGAFAGYFNSVNFFLILQTENTSSDDGQNIAQKLGQYVNGHTIENLSQLEQILIRAIKDLNLPADLSLAAGYVKDKIFYLKTMGEGQVFVKRGRDFAKIISSDQSASGHIRDKDLFILTTNSFTGLFSDQEMKRMFDGKDINKTVQKINIEDDRSGGKIAFFIDFNQEVKPEFTSPSLFSELRTIKDRANGKNIATIAVVSLIFIILLWSVGLGYKRRNDEEARKKIAASKEIITQKLTQSEDVAFLNLSRSQTLLSEAQTELDSLKSKFGNSNKKDIQELENLIREKESKITKKEEKTAVEFYDLAVDNQKAVGLKAGIDNDQMAVLDSENGSIYLLSLSKKSLSKKSSSKIKSATIVGVYDTSIFFYVPGDGIYKISDKDIKKIIDNDSEWGNITDFTLYNGNVYLLDPSNDQIYKYTAAEDGYSSKSLYVKDSESLSGASSISIDSSVYVSFKDYILKFTSGLRDGFKADFPESVGEITKVISGKDLDKAYVWDKDKGALYILGKDGEYQKQLKSGVLSKANDVVVFDGKAFILLKEKIYSLDLN